jgi:hypothetical protein
MKRVIFLILGVLVFTAFSLIDARAQTPRKSVPAAEVNGTFRMNFSGRFKGSSNDIKVWALGGGKLHIAMELMYPMMVRGELSANTGELDGTATIKGNTAVYESSEFGPCKITINFVRPGLIKVFQDGTDSDCGFGHNVMSTGTYHKISSRKPKFGT